MTVREIFGLNRELRRLQWVAGRGHAENQIARLQFINGGRPKELLPGDLLVIAPWSVRSENNAREVAEAALGSGAGAVLLGAEDKARDVLTQACGQAIPLISLKGAGLDAAAEGISAALLGEAAYTGYILTQFKSELEETDAHADSRETLGLLQRYLGYLCQIETRQEPIGDRPPREAEESACRIFPIQKPEGSPSFLKIAFPPGACLSGTDARLIACALPRLAFSLSLEESRRTGACRDKDEFFSQVVCGGLYESKETLAENCRLLGLPYGRRWVVWIMEFSSGFEYEELVVKRLTRFFEFYGKQVITAKDGAQYVFAADYEGVLAPRGKPEELLEKLFGHITHGLASGCIKAGVSSPAENAGEWLSAYQEALFALETAKKTGRERICYTDEDYTFRHLLHSLTDNPILKRMYSQLILPVLEYDRQNGSDLMDTLRRLAACNFNVNVAAEAMYFHRNTMYKRIKKINSLLNVDMSKMETQLILQMELELYARFGEWMGTT